MGRPRKNILFVGRVLGQVWLDRERDREGGGGRQRQGKKRSPTSKSKIIYEDLKIIGGVPSPTPLHPHPLSSTNSRTDRAGQTFKHPDAGQAARGGKASASIQLGG